MTPPERKPVVNALLSILRRHGDAEALTGPDACTTYSDLVEGAGRIKAHLSSRGVRAGAVIAVEGTDVTSVVQALLALADLEAIAVPITSAAPEKVAEYHAVAQSEWRLDVSKGVDGAELGHLGVSASHPLYDRLRDRNSPGIVLFSSGTTGRSKASVLDFNLMLARYYGRTSPQRILSFLNLDHIGGINTILHTFAHGGTIVTSSNRSPDEIWRTVETRHVSVLPTTPTFLTMTLISGAHLRHDLASLRVITYGTEPMPAQTLAKLAADLPAVRLKQTYGLSELGILATQSRASDSPWIKLGGAGFEYEIRSGVLWVKSQMAMLGYLNADAPFDDRGYFDTQDEVEQDGEWLRILGRTSEIINVGGEKVYPNEVESVLLEMSNVADVTVTGRSNVVTGSVVEATLKLIEPEDPRQLRRRIDAFCADRLEPYKIPAAVRISVEDQHNTRFKKSRASV